MGTRPKEKEMNRRIIDDELVMIQSCWLARNDILANVQIGKDGRLVYYIRVRISSDGTIFYPQFSKPPRWNGKWTHEEFDAFLRENLQSVISFIIGRLEPKERRQIKRDGLFLNA